jgi:hypothetical protein
VLVAQNDAPLTLRAVLGVSAKNAVISIQGEEVARGSVELSGLTFSVPKQKKKKILLRISYLDATQGLKFSHQTHLSIDSDPNHVDKRFEYRLPIKNGDFKTACWFVSSTQKRCCVARKLQRESRGAAEQICV